MRSGILAVTVAASLFSATASAATLMCSDPTAVAVISLELIMTSGDVAMYAQFPPSNVMDRGRAFKKGIVRNRVDNENYDTHMLVSCENQTMGTTVQTQGDLRLAGYEDIYKRWCNR